MRTSVATLARDPEKMKRWLVKQLRDPTADLHSKVRAGDLLSELNGWKRRDAGDMAAMEPARLAEMVNEWAPAFLEVCLTEALEAELEKRRARAS